MRRTQRLGHSSRLNYTRALASLPARRSQTTMHATDTENYHPHMENGLFTREISHTNFRTVKGRDDRHGYIGRGGKEQGARLDFTVFNGLGLRGELIAEARDQEHCFREWFLWLCQNFDFSQSAEGVIQLTNPNLQSEWFIVKTTTVSDGLRSPNFRSCSMKTNLANAQWFVLNRSKNPTCDNKIRMPRTTLMNRDLCHTNQQSRSSILQLHAVYIPQAHARNTVISSLYQVQVQSSEKVPRATQMLTRKGGPTVRGRNPTSNFSNRYHFHVL